MPRKTWVDSTFIKLELHALEYGLFKDCCKRENLRMSPVLRDMVRLFIKEMGGPDLTGDLELGEIPQALGALAYEADPSRPLP